MSTVNAVHVGRRNESRSWLPIVFILWPFYAFIVAIRNFRDKHYRNIVTLFFCYFGYTLVLSREGMDGYRHAQRFLESVNMTWDEFFTSLLDVVLRRSDKALDIYTLVVNFLVSRFTDSTHFLFFVHATIFSVISVKVLGAIYDEFTGKMDINARIFYITILFMFPISNVHFLRFPIATWLYILGTYQYLKTEKKKHLIWCALSVLVHFSFVTANAVLLIYVLLGNRNLIYLGILITSYVYPGLLYGYLSTFEAAELSEGVQRKISTYGNEDYINSRQESLDSSNWYRTYRVTIIQYAFIIGLPLVAITNKVFRLQDKFQKNLFSFLILFLAFVNFGFEFDSLGRRFVLVWIFFAAIYLYRYFQFENTNKLKFTTMLFILPIAFFVIMQIRIGFETMSPLWLIGNPIIAMFADIDTSVLDLIK